MFGLGFGSDDYDHLPHISEIDGLEPSDLPESVTNRLQYREEKRIPPAALEDIAHLDFELPEEYIERWNLDENYVPQPPETTTGGGQSNNQGPNDPDPRVTLDGTTAYDVEFIERTLAGDTEVACETAEGDTVAGYKVRRMIENQMNYPERAIWIGYDDSARGGFREAPIHFDALRRHVWLSGTTGSGKTTLLQNKCVQHAWAGHGFTFIDPKASGDTIELLQMLPEHRLDDVIFLEPGSTTFDKVVGINMLDMPAIEDDAEREKEIESRVENLVAVFDNDEYWGVNMQSITETMGRAMLQHNAEVSLADDRDPSEKYSVIDMYFILLNQQRRAEFVEEVDDPYLKEFLREIASMEDDTIRPLTKRIKSWVENAIVRKIISRRESSIDWDHIVDEDKILLVRIPVDSTDVHQMISLSVVRNLWSAKKRQDRDLERETKPYFLHLDEFEKVANDNLAVESMLVRARSMWLSVTLGTQYPYQIEKDHPDISRAVANNCNTKLAMRTPGESDAKVLMSNFEGKQATDLINTNFYRVWTKLPYEDGSESEPVNLKTLAPYPPLRDKEAAMDVIGRSLDRYGDEPLTDEQIQRELMYGDNATVDPATALEAANDDSETVAGAGESFTDEMLPKDVILEGIYAAQIQAGDETAPVSRKRATEEIERRLGDTGYQSQLSNAFEEIESVIVDKTGGETTLRLTEQGWASVMSADTGSSASGGGDDHRRILRESFRAFTALGGVVTLPRQEGDELPDGVVDLPIDPLAEADTMPEARELEEEFKEEYPRLHELTDTRHIAVEAETSTLQKPMQTLTNLRKAIEADKVCVFTLKDEFSGRGRFEYWAERGETVLYDEDQNGEITYDAFAFVKTRRRDNTRVFYNQSSKLTIDNGVYPVYEATDRRRELAWEELPSGEIMLSAGDDTLAQFPDPESAMNPEKSSPLAYREKTDEGWIVQKGAEAIGPYGSLDELRNEWNDIYEPFIPEYEFPRRPTSEDFHFVIFPDSDNPEYDEPMLYEEGELRPLLPDEMDWTPVGGIRHGQASSTSTQSQDPAAGSPSASSPLSTESPQATSQSESSPEGQAATSTSSAQASAESAPASEGETSPTDGGGRSMASTEEGSASDPPSSEEAESDQEPEGLQGGFISATEVTESTPSDDEGSSTDQPNTPSSSTASDQEESDDSLGPGMGSI